MDEDQPSQPHLHSIQNDVSVNICNLLLFKESAVISLFSHSLQSCYNRALPYPRGIFVTPFYGVTDT